MLGGLVLTPLLIYAHSDSFRVRSFKPIVYIVGLIIAASYVIFELPNGGSLIFALLPILLYAATKLSRINVLIISFVICLISILSTINGSGLLRLGQRTLFVGFRKSVNFVVGLQASEQRTGELANELTKELSESRQKFKEGERRLLFALDGSDGGIWDWNILKSEFYVSDQICKTYGWPQISSAKTLDDIKKYPHPEDLPLIEKRLAQYFAGEIPTYEVETRYQRLNGDWTGVLTRGKISERSPCGHWINRIASSS